MACLRVSATPSVSCGLMSKAASRASAAPVNSLPINTPHCSTCDATNSFATQVHAIMQRGHHGDVRHAVVRHPMEGCKHRRSSCCKDIWCAGMIISWDVVTHQGAVGTFDCVQMGWSVRGKAHLINYCRLINLPCQLQ